MKQGFIILLALAIASPVWALGPKEYTVNTEKSKIVWTGKKVTGEHFGDLALSSGSIMYGKDGLTATEVTMDMTSITVTDIEDPGYNAKLVGHLKSDDFFSVESHNQAMFKATKITPIKGAKKGEDNYTIMGDLTIKGISNPVSFPAKVEMDGDMLKAEGKAVFDRTKWSIKYGSGSFFDDLGDKMIYDDIEITFILVASEK